MWRTQSAPAGGADPRSIVGRLASQHQFWAHAPMEEVSENQELLAESRSRYISFPGSFVPVGHHCRAPLANGGLCQRQDRHKVGGLLDHEETLVSNSGLRTNFDPQCNSFSPLYRYTAHVALILHIPEYSAQSRQDVHWRILFWLYWFVVVALF